MLHREEAFAGAAQGHGSRTWCTWYLVLLVFSRYLDPMRREVATAELRWIDITDPDEADLRFLRDELRFHPVDVEQVMVRSRQPDVEPHPTYLFLIVHVPTFLPAERATVPAEYDIFVTPTVVVTAHGAAVTLTNELFDSVTKEQSLRDRYVGRGPAYLLYSIMDDLFSHVPRMFGHILERLDDAERRIFAGQERQMVTELSVIQRDLSGFRSVIRPQRHLYESGVLQGEWNAPAFQAVFRRLHGELARLWERLETMWERTQALSETNAMLLDHKLNEFLKLLTVLGALFIPFGLVAQTAVFLDASIAVPNKVIFWIIVGAMFIVDYIFLWRAKQRNLL